MSCRERADGVLVSHEAVAAREACLLYPHGRALAGSRAGRGTLDKKRHLQSQAHGNVACSHSTLLLRRHGERLGRKRHQPLLLLRLLVQKGMEARHPVGGEQLAQGRGHKRKLAELAVTCAREAAGCGRGEGQGGRGKAGARAGSRAGPGSIALCRLSKPTCTPCPGRRQRASRLAGKTLACDLTGARRNHTPFELAAARPSQTPWPQPTRAAAVPSAACCAVPLSGVPAVVRGSPAPGSPASPC